MLSAKRMKKKDGQSIEQHNEIKYSREEQRLFCLRMNVFCPVHFQ